MDIRRLMLFKDVVYAEGGLPADHAGDAGRRLRGDRQSAGGPSQRRSVEELIPIRRRTRRTAGEGGAGSCCRSRAISYGKAAIVGTSGDIEHAAAILHPRMGKPMRDAIGGGKAIIPSNVKIGAVGSVHRRAARPQG